MPLPWRAAWRIYLNTWGACTFTWGRTGEIPSLSISSALTGPARSAPKYIPGTAWWGPANPRTRRRPISKRNGKRRASRPRCIQVRLGKAGSNQRDLRRPSRPPPRNRRLLPAGRQRLPRRVPRPRQLPLRQHPHRPLKRPASPHSSHSRLTRSIRAVSLRSRRGGRFGSAQDREAEFTASTDSLLCFKPYPRYTTMPITVQTPKRSHVNCGSCHISPRQAIVPRIGTIGMNGKRNGLG